MTFNDSTEKLKFYTNWKEIVDDNFNRRSGVYFFVQSVETLIIIGKTKIKLPRKIVFSNEYERLRRKSIKNTIIPYKGKKITIKETEQIIPFGTYERKFKFSGNFSEIISDIIKHTNTNSCRFSDDLLEVGNYPIYGIDSKIKYPSYLLQIGYNQQFDKNLQKQKYYDILKDDELKSVLKDLLETVGINYDIFEIDPEITNVIFPIPYIRIIENRLSTSSEHEAIDLTLEFNRFFYQSFKMGNLQAKYKITELNGSETESNIENIEFTGNRIKNIKIRPSKLSKIGMVDLKILINNIEVNQFKGTYIRGFKIDTKIIDNE